MGFLHDCRRVKRSSKSEGKAPIKPTPERGKARQGTSKQREALHGSTQQGEVEQDSS